MPDGSDGHRRPQRGLSLAHLLDQRRGQPADGAAGGLARPAQGEAWRLLLAVGVLGGFTTFSSFSLETAMLVERGLIGTATAYAAGSLAAGLAGLFLGLFVMRAAA
jgi:fluoride ion exporter CrcB/FEX